MAMRNWPLLVDCRSIAKYNNAGRVLGREIDVITAISHELYSGIFEEAEQFGISAGEHIECYMKNNLFFEFAHPGTWGRKQLVCAIANAGALF